MRKIPATMASQHPDHASRPYWHDKEFISVTFENKECYLMFSELGIDEYKWDWEGKYVDESVIERLLSEYYDYFSKTQIGKDKFITFRLPNPKAETEFRLARAFINILSSAALTKKLGLYTPPLFEVILPMTETSDEIIAIQEAFDEIHNLKHEIFRFAVESIEMIEVIPLFEQVGTIKDSDKILYEYIHKYKKLFNKTPSYLRPYVARSDPALNSGLVPTILAIKIALSKYALFEKKTGIKMYPIIGTGSLPFRGSLAPDVVEEFVNEYKGVRTAVIQSAFRYDYDLTLVKEAVAYLNTHLPKNNPVMLTDQEVNTLEDIITVFEGHYKGTIEQIAPIINTVAGQLPKRRERVQHIGLFGYSRGIGNVKLPRAISFTAALYSLGIPPEIIGTGRGISQAKSAGTLPALEKHYLSLRMDLTRAGRFMNIDTIKKLIPVYPVLTGVLEDITAIEYYLGISLGPTDAPSRQHKIVSDKILSSLGGKKIPPELLTEAAILRKSMG